jgi:chromosome segregation ATPase
LRFLAWFFHKRRDHWKRKYQDLKAALRSSQNRIADLTKSRQQWRLKPEQADEQLAALESEVADLRAQVAAEKDKKTRVQSPSRETDYKVRRGKRKANSSFATSITVTGMRASGRM